MGQVITSFEKFQKQRKAQETIVNMARLSIKLPQEYLKNGEIDQRFKTYYGDGCGIVEDNFGKQFLLQCVKIAMSHLNTNQEKFLINNKKKEYVQEQSEVLLKFSQATKGLIFPLYKSAHTMIKTKMEDSLMGITLIDNIYEKYVEKIQNTKFLQEGQKDYLSEKFTQTQLTLNHNKLRRIK